MEKNLKEDSNDELSTWMAHYIAEKMASIKAPRGKARISAQRECFEAILTLWDYQTCFPHDKRPFKNFEAIFRALEHIEPNKTSPSYFRNENENNQYPKEVEQAIDLITALDAATRIMISFFVRESMRHATDNPTLEWLNSINGIVKSDETKIILELIDEDITQDHKEKRKNELSEQLARLEVYEALSREIKLTLKAELEKFE